MRLSGHSERFAPGFIVAAEKAQYRCWVFQGSAGLYQSQLRSSKCLPSYHEEFCTVD